jgi:hypothetical protein
MITEYFKERDDIEELIDRERESVWRELGWMGWIEKSRRKELVVL